ncbi:MAG: SprT family zinc-dependent metalloprotease [Caldisericia bacterium]|nr:SprT family zinc-dependent metalloprotease [Caldisericia bacterium]
MAKQVLKPILHTSIALQNHCFPVAVHFTKRKTLSLAITKTGNLLLRVPYRTHKNQWLSFLLSREKWILKHFQQWVQNHAKPIEYEEGKPFPIMGGTIPLHIELHEKKNNEVFWTQNGLIVYCSDTDQENIRKILQKWSRKMAIAFLSERVQSLLQTTSFHPFQIPIILRFRRMKRRWGSCSSKGIITLNTDLWKAPLEAIDYVIIHEMCHMEHMNHGREFKVYLTKMCPSWKDCKKLLKNIPEW